jgi:hypothetical protein
VPIYNELPSSWWSPEIRLHLLLRAHIIKREKGSRGARISTRIKAEVLLALNERKLGD